MTSSIKIVLASIILIFTAACQQTLVAVDTSPVPSETPLPQATARPTLTPGHIDLPTTPVVPTQQAFMPPATIPSVTIIAPAPPQPAPADILPGITLLLVPVANPDGLVIGRDTEGRFNANHVDLNRNWGCDWSTTAYWQSQLVNPGERAFSEPETRAVAGLIRDLRPSAAI